MTTHGNQTVLRRALLANASFSGLSAILCLEFSQPLGPWLGVDSSLLFQLGIELAIFAVGLIFLATRDHRTTWVRRTVGVVIGLDLLWVAASAVLLMSGSSLTVAGQWTVALVALAVADFAYFQWRGLTGGTVADPEGIAAAA